MFWYFDIKLKMTFFLLKKSRSYLDDANEKWISTIKVGVQFSPANQRILFTLTRQDNYKKSLTLL